METLALNLLSPTEALDTPLVNPPLYPPLDWWTDAAADLAPPKMTIYPNGRIAGVVAPAGRCLLDGTNDCWIVPRPADGRGSTLYREGGDFEDYAMSMVGTTWVEIYEGAGEYVEVPSACLAGPGGHAAGNAGVDLTRVHYDDTDFQVGRGRYVWSDQAGGLVFLGAVWDDLDERQIALARASACSVDYRWIGDEDRFRLIATCLVNVGGLPSRYSTIRRAAAAGETILITREDAQELIAEAESFLERVAVVAALGIDVSVLAEFNPDQPRDDHGRFGSGDSDSTTTGGEPVTHDWSKGQAAIQEPDGGFTLEGTGTPVTSGACVAISGYESKMSMDEFNKGDNASRFFESYIQKMVDDNVDGSVKMGGWHNPDTDELVLDRVQVFTSATNGPDYLDQAIQAGRDRGEHSIFNLDTGEAVRTGGQGSGGALLQAASATIPNYGETADRSHHRRGPPSGQELGRSDGGRGESPGGQSGIGVQGETPAANRRVAGSADTPGSASMLSGMAPRILDRQQPAPAPEQQHAHTAAPGGTCTCGQPVAAAPEAPAVDADHPAVVAASTDGQPTPADFDAAAPVSDADAASRRAAYIVVPDTQPDYGDQITWGSNVGMCCGTFTMSDSSIVILVYPQIDGALDFDNVIGVPYADATITGDEYEWLDPWDWDYDDVVVEVSDAGDVSDDNIVAATAAPAGWVVDPDGNRHIATLAARLAAGRRVVSATARSPLAIKVDRDQKATAAALAATGDQLGTLEQYFIRNELSKL